MNVLERTQACGCTASECDGLTCGTVVSTTAQDHSVTTNHTVEEAAGGCADAQAAPKVHHSNKSSGSGYSSTPSGRHPVIKKTLAPTRQHNDPRSARESIVEDIAVVAQPQLENVEEIRLQQSIKKGSQEETEALNVLVNDGSSVGAYTLDLIAPPKTTSEITQLPTLEPKRFLRDLRSGKVKQICVIVTKYVTDIRSVVLFSENERVLSSSAMDESIPD